MGTRPLHKAATSLMDHPVIPAPPPPPPRPSPAVGALLSPEEDVEVEKLLSG